MSSISTDKKVRNVPCPKCSQWFSKNFYLQRHLKHDQHNVLDCPFPRPGRPCEKVYTNYHAMVRHLQDDKDDHDGLGIDAIHKLVAEPSHIGLKPDQWVLALFRTKKSERLRNKATGNSDEQGGENTPALWTYDLGPQKPRSGQEPLDDGDPMEVNGEDDGYTSEPEEWWRE